MVLAPEHELVEKLTTQDQKTAVDKYIAEVSAKSEVERQNTNREKTGVFTGSFAINPINGEKIPIWVADYVLVNYGTGAVMAVPGEDERDFEFAEKFSLPVVFTTSENKFVSYQADIKNSRKKYYLANSGEFDGLDYEVGRQKIAEKIESMKAGKQQVQYKLRDWIFSRQHYWGEPIPIIHCPDCGAVAVPEDQLPVELPKVDNYEPTDTGESPLAVIDSWVNTTCPKCGGPAKRETDTMPNWAGSSWYYLRYFDANNDKAFADRKKLDYWGSVDMYLGGMEHTTLHLLYSRFWHQFFYDQGLVPNPEPYAARRGQGIVLASDGSKMSKSKGNVINPNEIIDAGYGADALRMGIAFLAPFDQTTPWNPNGVPGMYRFLNRVWDVVQIFIESDSDQKDSNPEIETKIQSEVHKTLREVTQDLENMRFNTALAKQMTLSNSLRELSKTLSINKASAVWQDAIEASLVMLAPFAPHFAEEMWSQLGKKQSIHIDSWVSADNDKISDSAVTVVIQINGKVRSNIIVESGTSKEDLIKQAQGDEKIISSLDGKEVKKIIAVVDKIVNFVV